MLRRFILVVVTVASLTVTQQDRATVTEDVRDPSGAVAPAIKVQVTNTETNAAYESQTNEAGQYRAPNLPIGTYKLTFRTCTVVTGESL